MCMCIHTQNEMHTYISLKIFARPAIAKSRKVVYGQLLRVATIPVAAPLNTDYPGVARNIKRIYIIVRETDRVTSYETPPLACLSQVSRSRCHPVAPSIK